MESTTWWCGIYVFYGAHQQNKRALLLDKLYTGVSAQVSIGMILYCYVRISFSGTLNKEQGRVSGHTLLSQLQHENVIYCIDFGPQASPVRRQRFHSHSKYLLRHWEKLLIRTCQYATLDECVSILH